MSVDNEDQFTMDHPDETNHGSQKELKVSYAREFLLSLRGLDVCKKLPSKFDESLLREFEDASQDRQRLSGDFSSHGFGRTDYSSSPPARGELGSYARVTHGRWDSHSSGRSDGDNDSHSGRDSDFGRRYGSQSRRPWQVPEHDGLLGKGSFPRQSGVAAGTSSQRFLSNDSGQLNKSNEPYQPPRPYKALPLSRRGAKDSLNDETFGSSDSTSEDRAEEERKRRASFELLRREQLKSFQEKQRSNPEGRKDVFDITELLGDAKDEKGRPERSNEADEPAMLPCSNSSSLSSQNSASRPLVPPGFASTVLERKSGPKTSGGDSQLEGSVLHAKGDYLLNGTSGNQEEKQPVNNIGLNEQKSGSISLSDSSADTSGRTLNLSSVLGIDSDSMGMDNQLEKLSNLSEVYEAPKSAGTIKLTTEKLDEKKISGNSNQEHAPSILDKLFNNALTMNGGEPSSFSEQNDSKREDTWSPRTVKSSKFAYLFPEEEKKAVDDNDISSSRPSGLLSLIQGADKFHTLDGKAMDHLSPGFPFQGHGTENSEQLGDIDSSKSPVGPPILTCEDLEQSILSEVGEKVLPLPPPPIQEWDIPAMRTEEQKANVDDRASQHLLSLLQQGTFPKNKDMGLPSNLGIALSEKTPKNWEGARKETDTGNSVSSGKSLTLEALFGTAFMTELQSVGEPVSGRAEVSELMNPGSELSQRDRYKTNGFPEALFGFDVRQTESDSRIGGFDEPADVRLLEEESLLTFDDHAKLQKLMPFRGSPQQGPEAQFDITEKLAALNSVARNERPTVRGQDRHFLLHPQNTFEPEIPFQHPNVVHPSPQLNNYSPVLHSFDSHHANAKSQINFMPQGNMARHDPSQNLQFPPSMIRLPFHHPDGGKPEFERGPHHMHMQGNLPPPHLLQGFPGGAPLRPHVSNQLPGLFPEMKPTQGFPFGHQQANYAGHGMPPVLDVNRSEHSGSVPRLIGMEPRADPTKQMPHRQGSFGHELDLGFGYR